MMAAPASDNMTSFETWAFRSAFENTWMSEAFARDTEAVLTKALTQSISNNETPSKDVLLSEFQAMVSPETTSSQQLTGQQSVSSSSEPETVSTNKNNVSKRPPRQQQVLGGKIAKRKSRASKRSPTTFIMADPANFRQMVQQVTGVKFGPGHVGPLFKPEPQRAGFGRMGNGGSGAGCLLPTLDTSAFLLEHHQQVVGPSGAQGSVGFGPGGSGVVGEVGSGPGMDFDGFSCFPTLESWKVM